MSPLTPSAEEVNLGTIVIKSDVYPDEGRPGVFKWVASHASGWSAVGEGSSHEDCMRQVNELVAAAIEEGGNEVGEPINVSREQYHGDAQPLVSNCACGAVSTHCVRIGVRWFWYCCRHFIAAGYAPIEGHIDCMAAAGR